MSTVLSWSTYAQAEEHRQLSPTFLPTPATISASFKSTFHAPRSTPYTLDEATYPYPPLSIHPARVQFVVSLRFFIIVTKL
jgi:hypothetical protein